VNWLYLGLLAAAAVVVASPVRIWADYRHRGNIDDSLLLKAEFLWGLTSWTLQVPVISSSSRGIALRARTGQGERSNRIVLPSGRLRRLEEFFRRLKKSKPLKLFLRSVKIRRLVWHTEIGLRDSARLGVLGGALWALKGAVCAGLQQTVRLHRPPVLRVAPRFNSSYFRTVISCILEFPLGYAIIAAFIAVYWAVKYKLSRKGERHVGTSNSGPDEDSHGEYQRNGGCQYSNR